MIALHQLQHLIDRVTVQPIRCGRQDNVFIELIERTHQTHGLIIDCTEVLISDERK